MPPREARRTDARPATFVFVHGMSHGAFCWAPIVERLARARHRTLAVDLPGHGPRAHEWRRATAGGYARAVADAMIQAGVHDAVLVGHSMGGTVIPKAAELVPSRVRHLVFVAAVVLPHGASLLGHHLPLASRAVFQGLARSGGGAVQYPASVEHSRWMTDLPPGAPDVVDTLVRLTREPARPWTERLDLRRFYAMRLPATYVRCLRDVAVTPARATEYAARLGVTPIDLDCGHDPMLSEPDALAQILERAAERP
jgi:pimeloyl-ACP methyl ester carboxylesterase